MRRIILAAMGFAAVLALGCTPDRVSTSLPLKGPRTVIAHVSVIPMDRDGVVPDQDVVIEGERITAISPGGSVPARADDRRIDGRGRFLMPGLWDMHVHTLGGDSARGEASGAQLAVAERLPLARRFGIVGLRDTGSSLASVTELKGLLKQRPDLPRVSASGPLIDGPKMFWSKAIAEPTADPAQSAAAAERIAEAGADFFKVYDGLTQPQLEAVIAVARRRGLKVTGHVPLATSIEAATSAGQNGVEHADVALLQDCMADGKKVRPALLRAWITEGYAGKFRAIGGALDRRDPLLCSALLKRLAERELFVTPALVHELKGPEFTLPSDQASLSGEAAETCVGEVASIAKAPAEFRRRAHRETLALVRDLQRAGVTLLAGSDAPNVCISHGYSLHRELQLLVEAGLSPQEALRAATVNGARWRGRSDEGRVAVGVRADLLLLSANPLDDIRHTLRIAGVAIGGRWTEPLGPPRLSRRMR
jgi:imidazolonepropionase-like amidohydrolase